MFNKLFKREFTNENFLQELCHHKPKEAWLKEAIDKKIIDINYQDESKNTFLMYCLKKNNFKSVIWLINNKADPTITNKENKAVIDILIEKNKIDLVEKLLKLKKIDINQKDEYGRSLLQNMIVSGNHKMAKAFIKNGANINTLDNKGKHIMYDALSYGDQVFVKYLLTFKNIELNDIDEDGNTLMQHPQIVQNDNLAIDLLVAGSDPTILDKNGESYFINTVLRDENAEHVVDVALEHGTDVNRRTSNNNTIMMELFFVATTLIKKNNKKAKNIIKNVKKMIEHKGDINALDADGESGLFNVVQLRNIELMTFLLNNNIDTNIQNSKGQTVLEDLVYDGLEYIEMIKLLLIYDINPKLKNKNAQTVYEILTNIILHNQGSKLIENEKLILLIDPDGMYMDLFNTFLENEELEEDEEFLFDFFDSDGNPLFFKPLIYDNFALFSLFTKYEINIHQLNKQHHNIFFAYVLKIFENNVVSPSILKNFKDNISSLISRKIDKDFKDSLGWTILHKVVATKCNIRLFDVLVKVVHFDYSTADNLGRTVMHNAVWHNNSDVIRILGKIDSKVLNIEDNYNITPIYYAALLGNKELVLQFFDLGSNITTSGPIDPKAIKKFKPMLQNLAKLKEEEEDLSNLNKLDSIIEQIKNKFGV